MRRLAILLALSGCGVTPRPAVEVRVQRVEIPVRTPCITAADIPVMPPKVKADLNGVAGHDLAIISASALRLRAFGMEALGLLQSCAK